MDKEAVIDQTEASVTSSSQQCREKVENGVQILSEGQGDKLQMDASGSDPVDIQNDREMSTGTLELMCDEQDTMFMEVRSPTGVAECKKETTMNSSNIQGFADVYAEQERLILTTFLKCLKRLITSGSIQTAMCASSAKTETACKRQPVQNGIKEYEFQRRHDEPR